MSFKTEKLDAMHVPCHCNIKWRVYAHADCHGGICSICMQCMHICRQCMFLSTMCTSHQLQTYSVWLTDVSRGSKQSKCVYGVFGVFHRLQSIDINRSFQCLNPGTLALHCINVIISLTHWMWFKHNNSLTGSELSLVFVSSAACKQICWGFGTTSRWEWS